MASRSRCTRSSNPISYTQTAEVVKEQLKELNIEVNVLSEEIGTFAKRVGDGDFEWCATGRGMRHDPTGYLVDFGRPNAGAAAKWFSKGDGWKNQALSDLYEQMAVNLDIPRASSRSARSRRWCSTRRRTSTWCRTTSSTPCAAT